jgi:3-oxoacyl-[acyl-carrier protein] reductase
MNLQLDDKTVLVTGAGGGIGRATAEAFAAEGARLALHARSSFRGLSEWLSTQPWRDRAVVLPGDVTRPEEIEDVFDRAAARFGRVDVTVANAGIWAPEDLRLDQLPVDRIRRTVEVNLLGSIFTARAFFRVLARTGPRPDGDGAALLFVGSTAGRFGEAGHADYAASKAALAGLVRSLKNEIVRLDPYARVNMVEPGWTVTEMARDALSVPGAVRRVLRATPVRQLSRPADIARALVLLASPAAARNVSGETITVAGGMEGRVQWEPEEIDPGEVARRLDT